MNLACSAIYRGGLPVFHQCHLHTNVFIKLVCRTIQRGSFASAPSMSPAPQYPLEPYLQGNDMAVEPVLHQCRHFISLCSESLLGSFASAPPMLPADACQCIVHRQTGFHCSIAANMMTCCYHDVLRERCAKLCPGQQDLFEVMPICHQVCDGADLGTMQGSCANAPCSTLGCLPKISWIGN